MYKFLRPHDSFPGQSPADRLRQIHLRVEESRQHPELNPLAYDEVRNCLVSRFVFGRLPSKRESDALVRRFVESHRGYVIDLGQSNLLIGARGPVAVDFAIEESHPDWRARIDRDMTLPPASWFDRSQHVPKPLEPTCPSY